MKDKFFLIVGLFFVVAGLMARIFFVDSSSLVNPEDFKTACVYSMLLGGLFLLGEVPFIKRICER